MSQLPAVRELSQKLSKTQINSLLINIHDDVGLTMRERLDFQVSPTYVVLLPDGREVLREHETPSLEAIQAAISANS